MRKAVQYLILVMLLMESVYGGSEIEIKSVEDLKRAAYSPQALEILRKPEIWLPDLVSSLQWKTRVSEHFVLHYHIDASDENDSLFDSLSGDLEKLYGELHEFLQIEARTKQERLALKTRLVCFIIKTNSNRTFGTLPDPHLLFYLLDPQKDPHYLMKLRHELAHWIWGRMYGEAPPLFNEGVAVYAERLSAAESHISEFLARAPVEAEGLPSLSEVTSEDGFWKFKGMYTLGSYWIHFLVERWGWGKLKEFFLASDFEDENVIKHFEEVYGETFGKVEAEWWASLSAK